MNTLYINVFIKKTLRKEPINIKVNFCSSPSYSRFFFGGVRWVHGVVGRSLKIYYKRVHIISKICAGDEILCSL